MAASRTRTDLGQRLLQLRRDLEDKREERAQLQGELKSLFKQLSEDYRVDDLEKAGKLMEKMEEEIAQAEQEIQKGIDAIKRLMESEEEE